MSADYSVVICINPGPYRFNNTIYADEVGLLRGEMRLEGQLISTRYETSCGCKAFIWVNQYLPPKNIRFNRMVINHPECRFVTVAIFGR